jgi:hypothetical protein
MAALRNLVIPQDESLGLLPDGGHTPARGPLIRTKPSPWCFQGRWPEEHSQDLGLMVIVWDFGVKACVVGVVLVSFLVAPHQALTETTTVFLNKADEPL